MAHQGIALALLVLALATPRGVIASDRLAVIEFFGRPLGAYCSAAGPAMKTLQNEMEGRAILLEYDFDLFRNGRIDRFFATGVSAPALPLVMVGDGYRTSSGYLSNYESTYRSMINAELAREPEAHIQAYWQRIGSVARVWVHATNLAGRTLKVSQETAIWGIAWEDAMIGVSQTWVRGANRWATTTDFPADETIDSVFLIPVQAETSWNNISCLALLENRTAQMGRYDILQAAVALPSGLYLRDKTVSVNNGRRSAEIKIEGPHVLSWSAESTAPWLEVTPSGNHLPDSITVTLVPELRPPAATTAVVVITASGEGMEFSERAEVEIVYPVKS